MTKFSNRQVKHEEEMDVCEIIGKEAVVATLFGNHCRTVEEDDEMTLSEAFYLEEL